MAQWRMYHKCYVQHSHTLAQVVVVLALAQIVK